MMFDGIYFGLSGEARNRGREESHDSESHDSHQRWQRQSQPGNAHRDAGHGAEVGGSIDTISTNSSGFLSITAPKADKVLKYFAETPAIAPSSPFKAEDLSESFQDTSTELRSQYSVTYRSSNHARDGSLRSVKIETARVTTLRCDRNRFSCWFCSL